MIFSLAFASACQFGAVASSSEPRVGLLSLTQPVWSAPAPASNLQISQLYFPSVLTLSKLPLLPRTLPQQEQSVKMLPALPIVEVRTVRAIKPAAKPKAVKKNVDPKREVAKSYSNIIEELSGIHFRSATKPSISPVKVSSAHVPTLKGNQKVAAQVFNPSGSVDIEPQTTNAFANVVSTSVVEPMAPEMKLCTLNLNAAPLTTAITNLCRQTNLNLILLADAKAPITISVKDMPIIDAINHICSLTGLNFIKLNKAMVIGTSEQLKAGYPKEFAEKYPVAEAKAAPAAAALEFRSVRVNYMTAQGAAESLKPFFEGRNLIASAAPPSVAPLIEIQNSTAATGATGVQLTGQKGNNDNGSRLVMLRGPKEVVEEAIQVLKQMDQPKRQVAIQVTIHDIANDALREVGVGWTFGNLALTENNTNGVLPGSFDRAPTSFTGVLKSLETADRAKLLASPNVTVQDGERGFILIGDRLTFPVLVSVAQGQPVFNIQQERVGIYLQVAGEIADDGSITLTIAPQVSAVKSFIEVNGASYPQISTREAQSTIRLKSGESIVLGGLIRDEDIEQMERVPMLSQIPVFGELFKRRKKQKRSSQLIITVTPTLLKQ